MKIIIGADHAGFKLKEHIKEYLLSHEHQVYDVGCYDENPVDYPDQATSVSRKVGSEEYERGILVCGTGIGMSITANKVPGIRAARVSDTLSAQLSRAHNDSNVLCLGGWIVGEKLSEEILNTWLNTPYEEGKHVQRLEKISRLEADQ
jgi:ribose 5-phosphate isomerase B